MIESWGPNEPPGKFQQNSIRCAIVLEIRFWTICLGSPPFGEIAYVEMSEKRRREAKTRRGRKMETPRGQFIDLALVVQICP